MTGAVIDGYLEKTQVVIPDSPCLAFNVEGWIPVYCPQRARSARK